MKLPLGREARVSDSASGSEIMAALRHVIAQPSVNWPYEYAEMESVAPADEQNRTTARMPGTILQQWALKPDLPDPECDWTYPVTKPAGTE